MYSCKQSRQVSVSYQEPASRGHDLHGAHEVLVTMSLISLLHYLFLLLHLHLLVFPPLCLRTNSEIQLSQF
ncbi:hypothetical protein E2C01_035386 [Portunus trituberculatus]|uniref:Uncharacterized protein n=1 Tax=Portunus trituberculatus TaxID=210409 RepID=A0A5B7F425_PORTR|nr:hypothetical protein [Portunus trituberculatus]